MSAPPNGVEAPSSTSSRKSYESSSSLPKFTSVRHRTPSFEQGESSSPDSWRAENKWSRDLSDHGDIVEAPEPIEEDHETPSRDTDSHGSRRHRPRHSGGFLLETVFAPAKRHSDGLISFKHKGEDEGKRKSEDGGIIVPKRRATHHHHRPKQSIASSPLSVEQTQGLQAPPPANGLDGAGVDGATDAHVNGNSRKKTIKLDDAPSPPHHSRANQRGQRPSVPGIGFDTDPAQIVNLALNLSENRRRTISSGRFGPDPSRRIVSSGSASSGPADALNYVRQGGSLRQHLMQQRKMSRNISPSSTPMRKASMASPRLNSQSQRRMSRAVSSAVPDEASDEEVEYEISESTLARAAKARQHFELFYEHRRLISILPPLRHAPSRAHTADPEQSESYEPGRIYNPLQYIRNRKLRWREKSPLWSEADGWNDAEKVRPWLDKVAEDHKEPSNDPDECIRLPQLQDERHEPKEDSSPAPDLHRPTTNVSQKPRRPRMDWIISPPDLLADSFWLEQGLNKTKIEDRDGNKLYPQNAQLKFTGWRVRTPGIHPVSSNDSSNVGADKLKSQPDLPTFRSQSAHGSEGKGRGRKRHHFRDSIHTLSHSHSHSGSREKPSRLLKAFTKPDTASSSSDSEAEGFRGRKKRIQNIMDQDSETISSAALEKQMLAMLEQDTAEETSSSSLKKKRPLTRDDTIQSTQPDFSSKEPSGEGIVFNSDVFQDRNHSLASVDKPKPGAISSVRSSVDQERARHSFEEMDSTAPNSPTANGFIPSIAINLSPPASRSPSPTKKHLPARLFRADRSRSKQRQGISAEDFAVAVEENQERKGRSSAEIPRPVHHREGTASPKTKRSSLTAEDANLVDLRRTQSAQVKGSKPVPPPDSRIRGMFKGGRIAEIVGTEVSRVGDFIWKRDAPNHGRAPSSASSIVSEESSPEYGPIGDGLTTPKAAPKSYVRRITTTASESDRLSRRPTEKETPKYHNPNLPTFRSPFNKEKQDGDVSKTPLATPLGDHISRQQVVRRETSRHGRFERLAPPRIDIRDVSPGDSDVYDVPSSPGTERRESYGFGEAMNANKRFNDALNSDGILKLDRPVTGLAALDVGTTPGNRRPTIRDKRDWSISQRSMSTSREAPTSKRDIARVRALLLSNGVKAMEISRRARLVRDPPPPWLLQIAKDANETLPPTSRKDEHVYAARILVREIDASHRNHQIALEEFSDVTVPQLHGRLHDLDDLVSNSLILRARSAGDDAGAQSAQLTTTRTLAVKQLNDGIDVVIRARRRRLRWARRMGYFLLEWTVLGLLWAVWLVVMIYQFVKGGVMILVRSVRWMLFL